MEKEGAGKKILAVEDKSKEQLISEFEATETRRKWVAEVHS